MKDLGYERTATDAKLRVEMPDGSLWDVPIQLIADSRDQYYQDEKEDTIGFIRAGELDAYEIKDWAENNMNWSDVREYAVKARSKTRPVDFEEGWANGAKEIIGSV